LLTFPLKHEVILVSAGDQLEDFIYGVVEARAGIDFVSASLAHIDAVCLAAFVWIFVGHGGSLNLATK
jgi:hypothetical protein